jgi:hypothetical protein
VPFDFKAHALAFESGKFIQHDPPSLPPRFEEDVAPLTPGRRAVLFTITLAFVGCARCKPWSLDLGVPPSLSAPALGTATVLPLWVLKRTTPLSKTSPLASDSDRSADVAALLMSV